MKQNTKYDENWETKTQIDFINIGAIELSDMIEDKLKVKGRKSKLLIKEANDMIGEYNTKFGYTYAKVK